MYWLWIIIVQAYNGKNQILKPLYYNGYNII